MAFILASVCRLLALGTRLTCRISDIKPEDGGVYMCMARNQYGVSAPLVHTIEVGRAAPQPPVEPPVITGASSTKLGSSVC